METEPQSEPTEIERLDAALAKLESERDRRRIARNQPVLMAVPHDGEPLRAAQQRALYEYLAKCPDAPKTVSAFDWMVIEFVSPKPVVELPSEQFGQPAARDVSPTRGPPPARPARSLPAAPGAGALSADPRSVNDVDAAERRRTQRFNDDEWGSPAEHPLRYPKGNRNGW